MVQEKINFLKGGYELTYFLSKYGFSYEIIKSFSFKVTHINYILHTFEISNFCSTKEESLHKSYLKHVLNFRSPKIQALLKKIPRFSFDNLIDLSKKVEKWKLEETWKEFDLLWNDYDLDSYFNPTNIFTFIFSTSRSKV